MKKLNSMFCKHEWELVEERKGTSTANVVGQAIGGSYYRSYLYKCEKCGKLKVLAKNY